MKKILLFLSLAFCFSNTITAQIEFGVKGGLNYSTVDLVINNGDFTGIDLFEERRYLPNIHLGIFLTKKFGSRSSLETNLLFSREGFESIPPWTTEEGKMTMNYINVPILYGYRFLSKAKVLAGVDLGYLLNAKFKSGGNKVDRTDSYSHRIKIGGVLGFGYSILENMEIEARYVHGLTSLTDQNNVTITDDQGTSLGVVNVKNKSRLFQLSLKYSI